MMIHCLHARTTTQKPHIIEQRKINREEIQHLMESEQSTASFLSSLRVLLDDLLHLSIRGSVAKSKKNLSSDGRVPAENFFCY